MQTLLTCGLAFGAIAGVAHAYGMWRARRRSAPVSGGRGIESAAYVAAWTIGLWLLFGTYVLSLWLLATIVYAGTRAWQIYRPAAG